MIALVKNILGEDDLVVVLRMTALLVLLRGFGGEYAFVFDILLSLCCIGVVLSDVLLRKAGLWFTCAGIAALVLVDQWYVVDNHKYLLTYWFVACGVALCSKDGSREDDAIGVLRTNARLLIGFLFFVATFWKFYGGELVDGAFFEGTFLLDPRFRALAMLVSGLSVADLEKNQEILSAITLFPGASSSASVVTNDALQAFSFFTSWWVIFIEGTIALSFLLTPFQLLYRNRDYFLFAFIGSTYMAAPVDTFALTLTVMGYCQCERENVNRRLMYVVFFFLLQFVRLIPSLNEMTIYLLSR